MDRLTMERKEIPVYAENLYKWTWTPKPSILKQDVHWNIPVLEELDCPYCKDETGDCIIDDSSIITYISGNHLWIELFEPHDLTIVFGNINYCPMCGRLLE